MVAIDPDVAVPVSWPHAEVPLLSRPSLGPESSDCNENGIDDAFDIAGLIPRGPYLVPGDPHPAWSGEYRLEAGDLDGDGDIDLAVSSRSDGTITILWQRSFRRFDRNTTINVNPRPEFWAHILLSCFSTSDLDLDGDIDLVVGIEDHSFLVIMRNDGRGHFELEELPLGDSDWANCVEVTDIDNDRFPDILVTSGTTGPAVANEKVILLRNSGEGIFSSREYREVNIDDIQHVTSADLDGDNYPEIIFEADDFIGIIENETGSGNAFSNWVLTSHNLPGREDNNAIVAADLWGDAGVEVVALRANGVVNVLPNTDGSLSVPEDLFDYTVGSGGEGISAGDITQDGDFDVVVPERSTDTLALLYNFNRSSLNPAIHLPVSDEPLDVLVVNLDSDSRLEIALVHRETHEVWVIHVRPEPVSYDCNNNGRPDSCDIRDNPVIDEDRDGVPDSCRGQLPMGGTAPPWL